MRSPVERDRGGRPALTSAHELAELAQDLFLEHGFEHTTVDDIAAAAGISRRTFFRYFSTKADVLWVESPAELARLRELLGQAPAAETYDEVLVRATPEALRHPPEQRKWALHRAQLILNVPLVQEKAAARHQDWRRVVTEFVADRRATGPGDLVAVAVGHAVLGATLAAHEYWLAHPDEELWAIMTRLLRLMIPRAE
ncbi:TetR family transcriptional regulator [Nocardia sp. NPDC050799]|uniref:acyl-CoA-like ligand-binding transcription factor n=1 Tax=Nocardia sp. NPDC050799 TaxID=3154842 RepID=UPI0033EA742F